jgi:hypothetical protein
MGYKKTGEVAVTADIYNQHIKDFDYIKTLDLERYFYDNDLSSVIGVNDFVRPANNGPNDTFVQEGGDVFLPDCADLARLHAIVRKRKALTVLEFGGGISTKVLANAISLNQEEWGDTIELVRRQNPFKVHSVEAEQKYADLTKGALGEYGAHVEMHVIDAIQTTYNDRACGRYRTVPSVCPDLIYIDGPSPYSYFSDDAAYINMSHPDLTNITCDLIHLEAFLLPGTFVVFDGMTNNARFNCRALSRSWRSHEDVGMDYTMLVLDEAPIGIHHINQLKYISN